MSPDAWYRTQSVADKYCGFFEHVNVGKLFTPNEIISRNYANLHRHGLGQPEILELIAIAGLAVYANIMADATGMEEDTIFAALS